MTPFMRRVHLFAVATQVLWLVLFAWAFSRTGAGVFAALSGWCAFFGALSTHALRQARRK